MPAACHRPYVLLAVSLAVCNVFVGCGRPTKNSASQQTEGSLHEADGAGESPDQFEKYLPDTPLNRKVAGLLDTLCYGEGRDWRIAVTSVKLQKLFPDAVEPLLTLAQNPNCRDADFALLGLASGDLGPHKERVSEFLRRARQDKSPEMRASALHVTFSQHLPDATTDLLRSAYADKAWEVREEVMSIIGILDEPPREQLVLLVDGLQDQDEDVRAEALEILDDLGAQVKPIVGELRKLLASDDEYVRGGVLAALGVCGPTEEDMAAIYAACESDDVPIRYHAAAALVHCDLADPKVADLALKVFDAAEWAETRSHAAEVLAHVYPVQERIVLRLAKALGEPDLPYDTAVSPNFYASYKDACLRSLRFIGPDARAALYDVLRAHRKEWLLESTAMRAARVISPRHPEVIQYYKAQFAAGRFSFADTPYLRSLGEDARYYAKELLHLLEDDDEDITRGWLLEDLHRIRGIPADRLLPILLQNLRDDDVNTRGYSCLAIGALGEIASSAVPELIEQVVSTDRDARFARSCAIDALAQIGPAAETAVPHLRKVYDEEEPRRAELGSPWRYAAAALAKLDGEYRTRILETLRRDLGSSDEECRQRALSVLGDVGPVAAPLLDDLRRLAADNHDDAALGPIAVALIRVGDESMGARLALDDLRSADEDRQVQGCQIAGWLTEPKEVDCVLPVLRRLRSLNLRLSGEASEALASLTGKEVDVW